MDLVSFDKCLGKWLIFEHAPGNHTSKTECSAPKGDWLSELPEIICLHFFFVTACFGSACENCLSLLNWLPYCQHVNVSHLQEFEKERESVAQIMLHF